MNGDRTLTSDVDATELVAPQPLIFSAKCTAKSVTK